MNDEILALLTRIDRNIDELVAGQRKIEDELATLREEKRAAKRKYSQSRKKGAYPPKNKPRRKPGYKKARKYPKP